METADVKRRDYEFDVDDANRRLKRGLIYAFIFFGLTPVLLLYPVLRWWKGPEFTFWFFHKIAVLQLVIFILYVLIAFFKNRVIIL